MINNNAMERFLFRNAKAMVINSIIAYDTEFKEDDHPRAGNGKFVKKGTGGGGSSKNQKDTKKAQYYNEPGKVENSKTIGKILFNIHNAQSGESIQKFLKDGAKVGDKVHEDKRGRYFLVNVKDSYFKFYGLNDNKTISDDPKTVKSFHVNNPKIVEEAQKEFSQKNSTSAPSKLEKQMEKIKEEITGGETLKDFAKKMGKYQYRNTLYQLMTVPRMHIDSDQPKLEDNKGEYILVRYNENDDDVDGDDTMYKMYGSKDGKLPKDLSKLKIERINNNNDLESTILTTPAKNLLRSGLMQDMYLIENGFRNWKFKTNDPSFLGKESNSLLYMPTDEDGFSKFSDNGRYMLQEALKHHSTYILVSPEGKKYKLKGDKMVLM